MFGLARGATAKATTRVFQRVLGDYARQAAPDLLVLSKHDRHPTERADLCGTRLVISSEVEDGRRLAEALVKDLTGGDRKKARFMNRDFFEFDQSFSIFLLCKNKPVVTGTDQGIWRRLRLVPWEERIPEDERRSQDDVVAELVAEGSGVLAWMMRGLEDYLADPHWVAQEVHAATQEWRQHEDRLGPFLADCCEFGPHFTIAVAELYSAYSTWAEVNGEEPLGKRHFGDMLRQRGIGQKKGEKRMRRWVGIRVVAQGGKRSGSFYTSDNLQEELEAMPPNATADGHRGQLLDFALSKGMALVKESEQ